MFDVIVVGARVAGASTAMLLARKGYRVMVVDRASFPSDTISTHQVQLPGIAKLKRWGLLDKVIATNAPPAAHVYFDAGFAAFEGCFPEYEGIAAVYSPRRTHLDKILVDAAVDAGAEIREACVVDEVVFEDNRACGIRGHDRNGAAFSESAALIIGADGKHSLVAKAVKAPVIEEKPALSCGYYSYFSGVPLRGGEIYNRERRAIGAWPTNDGLAMIYIAWPIQEFNQFRADVEGNFLRTIELIPGLAERVHAGRREERIYGTADMPNYFRKSHGPGWALVGDAGYIKDAITAQGISDAFIAADGLAEAIDECLSGEQPLETALSAYEERRNRAARPMYEFTTQLAAFNPPSIEQRILFAALREKPAAVQQFLGMLTGVVPVPEFFAPANLFRVIGFSGMAKIMASKLRQRAQNR